MIKKESDISQINSYLKGELDSKAMHLLEKQALDDPFLMDALEGYENNNSQQVQLDEIRKRLQQRVSKPERRIIPLRFIAIAASVLIVISICGTWFYSNRYLNSNKKQIAENIKPVVAKPPVGPAPANLPVVSRPIVQNNKSKEAKHQTSPRTLSRAQGQAHINYEAATAAPAPEAKEKIATEERSDKILKSNNNQAEKDTTPLSEMIVMDYTSKKKSNSAAKMAQITTSGKSDTVSQQLLQGQYKGVAANNVTAPKQDQSIAMPLVAPNAAPALKEVSIQHKDYSSAKKTVKGRVVGSDDGLPMPGVSVKVAGSNTGTQTDVNGYFNLPVTGDSEKLVVGFIGYQTVEVNAHKGDSLKTIPLKPSGNALSEVVVTGYSSQNKNPDTVYTSAHPKAGWGALRKYLRTNAISPDGKSGTVKLSFEVNHDGVITKIQVVSGISDMTNQKAVDLIKNGPAWVGNTNGAPETVKVRIKFSPKQQ